MFDFHLTGCQFDVPRSSLIKVDSHLWCPYHCPMKNKTGVSTEKAGWDEERLATFHSDLEMRCAVALKSKSNLDFTGVVFPTNVTYDKLPPASFAFATFEGQAIFSKAAFKGLTHFTNASFHGSAWFNGATFADNVLFHEATFGRGEGKASFNEATFSRMAYFDDVTFGAEASFDSATFESFVYFRGATFEGPVDFSGAMFESRAEFFGTTFKDLAWFQEVTFKSLAEFQSSGEDTSEEQVKSNLFLKLSFANTTFGDQVSFENRRFLQSASFEGCTFESAPIFHGCTLHQGMRFPSRKKFIDVTSPHAAQAYRTLKISMAQFGARQEEAMFYALEHASLRSLSSTPRTQKLVSWVYLLAADYGESFLRPLAWLTGTTLVFWMLYVGLALLSPTPNKLLGVCLNFTIEQLVRPFSVWQVSGGTTIKSLFLTDPGLLVVLRVLSTVQSTLSVIFLALFIFALRRRFKLG